MKRIIFLLMIISSVICKAEDFTLTENGTYEVKRVVEVDSVKSGLLFSRAMETLSDWTGPDGKARTGIDYSDRESGIIIFKGSYSLGFKETILGEGWDRHADYTMKIKCKDGKAQVTVTIQQIRAQFSQQNISRDISLPQLQDMVNRARGSKRERGIELLNTIARKAKQMSRQMCQSLLNESEDDDF